ncbi:MAG: ribonuclease HI [Candidatus Azotimanducaceae bacterium]
MAKKKYYVIWEGRQTGIFEDWPTAQAAVAGHKGAKFKGFESRALAEAAFSQAPEQSIVAKKSSKPSKKRPAFELDENFDVHIFCDGGCDPNPGPAASGIIVYQSGSIQAKYHGLYHRGTNNTAELNALFEAMRLAQSLLENGLKVQILSDSSYSVKAMTQWAAGWQRKNWTRGKGDVLANAELIKKMYECYVQLPSSLSIIHVKGHSGVEGNELADRMCFVAMQNKVTDFEKYEGTESIEELLALTAG